MTIHNPLRSRYGSVVSCSKQAGEITEPTLFAPVDTSPLIETAKHALLVLARRRSRPVSPSPFVLVP